MNEHEELRAELEQAKDALTHQTSLLELLRKENSEMEDVIIHLKAELYDYMSM